MRKLTQTLLISSILTVSAVAAGTAFAGHGKGGACFHGKHMGMGHGGFDSERRLERMTQKLDLSAEQQDQIKAIFDANQAERQALRENMQQNREALRNLMTTDSPNEADIRALAETQGQFKANMIVMKAKTRQAIAAVLTDEQKAKMQAMRDKRHRGKSL